VLDEAGYDWIIGVRLRNRPVLADHVLSDPGPFEVLTDNLEVKEVWADERRYIVCRNPDQVHRDAARRQAVLDRLEARLTQSGVKGVVTRPGFRRLLRVSAEEAIIDRDKVERDARYDGVWVLETSTDLPAPEVAEAYKSLWRVERAFRTLKSPLELRPVRHWTESRIRGHVVVCFLAFLLRSALERRLFEDGSVNATFAEVLDALHQVQEVRVDVKGIPLQLVTEAPPLAQDVFQALGMRTPPRLQKLA
jgi:hypothetical protein